MADQEAERVRFVVEVPGAAEAARDFETVAATLGKTAKKANDNDKAFADFKKALDAAKVASESLRVAADKQVDTFGKLSQNASRGAQVVSAFTGALGGAVPGLDLVTGAVSRTSGAIGAMSGILGGAAGVATGGIILAVGLFAKKIYEVTEETKKLAKATVDYSTTLERELGLIQAADKAASLKQQLDMGVAPLDVTLAAARVKEARQQEVRYKLDTFPRNEFGTPTDPARFAALTKEAAALRVEVGKLHSDIARIKAEDAQFAIDDAKNEMERKKGEAFAPTARGRLEFARSQGAIASAGAALDAQKERDERTAKYGGQLQGAEVDRQKRENDLYVENLRTRREATIREAKETDKRLEEIDKKRAERNKLFNEAGITGLRELGGTASTVFSAIAKGEKVTGSQILASIGDQLVGKGTFYLFEGLARALASFGADPSAPGLIGLGTAEIAAGMAMGAVASRGGSKSSGAGASAPVYYVQNETGGFTKTAIEPAARPSTAVEGGQVININMPTVVSPTVDDAKRIEAAMDAKRRRGV